MKLIKGKNIADKILVRIAANIRKNKLKPGLAVVLVGSDKASEIYVNLKEKAAVKVGIKFFKFKFPANISEKKVIKLISDLNKNKNVHGIIVQLPLPNKFKAQKIINAISLGKDADGFSAQGGSAYGGHPQEKVTNIQPVFPKAIVEMIKSTKKNVKGKNGIVIANSDMFGKIMTEALRKIGLQAEYILSKDIKKYTYCLQRSDVVVTAVGKPEILKGNIFKNGAIVIDGGIAKRGKKVFGDVDAESVQCKNIFLSPVPGGVGPVTIACLLENVYKFIIKTKNIINR